MTQHERELFEEHEQEKARQILPNYTQDHFPVMLSPFFPNIYTWTEVKGPRLRRRRRASLATYQQEKTGELHVR